MKLLEGLPKVHSLTAEREAAFAKRGRAGRTKLVLHTMREAFVYAKQCCRGTLPDDDIYSMCYWELQASARRYKSKFGRFFAYAKVNIRGRLSREFKRLDVVKHSSGHHEDSILSTQIMQMPELFLEEDGADQPLAKVGCVDPEFDLIDIHEKTAIITPILRAKLTTREQQIIELRYKSGFNFTKIGELFGVTRQAAEMAHGKALQKVRRELGRRAPL